MARRKVELLSMPLSACCGGYKQSPHDFCALCPIKGTVKDGEQLSRFVGFEPCNQCHTPTDCISRCKCWVLFGSEPAPAPESVLSEAAHLCSPCPDPNFCGALDSCPQNLPPESVLSEAARLVDGDRQTAYLAGPMRGLPDYNFPAFHAAAADLRDRGYTVLSPAEGDVHDGFNPETGDGLRTFKEYMQRDLALVCSADLVVVLPGWQKSQGARLEVQVATAVGLNVLRYPDLQPARHASSERFHRLLGKLAETHDKKAADYGTDGDSLANVRACEKHLGVPAWVGVEIRIGDKNQRIASFLAKGELQNESIEDSVLDRAVYSLIQLVLLEEAAKASA